MKLLFALLIAFAVVTATASAQSGNRRTYSESVSRYDRSIPPDDTNEAAKQRPDDDVVRIETDLVTIPVRVTTRSGRPVPDIKRAEFRVFENGEPQEIAYFATDEAPFTVALLLDMSYSTVFKLREIQSAALQFVAQLKPSDKVMIVAFDQKVRVLCTLTNDRKALRYAIEGSNIGSGTSLYDAVSGVINDSLRKVRGRKAVVMLTDGVDTTSKTATMRSILKDLDESDVLIYPIQYDTYRDVQESRKKDAEIRYDEDDNKYVVEAPPAKGERDEDYAEAKKFLSSAAEKTGGRVQKVNDATNLAEAFARIADELRKTYSLGYYPSSDRQAGARYYVRVRVYRPDLVIRARETYLKAGHQQ